jgi:hypothetical protein
VVEWICHWARAPARAANGHSMYRQQGGSIILTSSSTAHIGMNNLAPDSAAEAGFDVSWVDRVHCHRLHKAN